MNPAVHGVRPLFHPGSGHERMQYNASAPLFAGSGQVRIRHTLPGLAASMVDSHAVRDPWHMLCKRSQRQGHLGTRHPDMHGMLQPQIGLHPQWTMHAAYRQRKTGMPPVWRAAGTGTQRTEHMCHSKLFDLRV